MHVNGKTALVTGGASGLGQAIVELFHRHDANVIIADLNEDNGKSIESSLGNRALYVKTDISDTEDVKNVCKAAVEKFGAIHVLINSAGIGAAGKIVGKDGPFDIEKLRKIVSVNVIGTFQMISNVAFEMIKNEPEDGERGIIINLASVAAFEGQIGQAAYSATKGAIVGMTLPIARDLARDGIRVCTIAPGTFDTPLLNRVNDEIRQALGKAVPFPSRIGRPEELAWLTKAIVEIPYLNGEVIRIDGAIRMAPR